MRSEARDVVVGVFRDDEQARDAIRALQDAGFEGDDISILMPDRGAARDMAADTGTRAGAGAATGAIAGGILGGLGGWLVGIGALAIPGVGPFIAAGAFATALTGAALGAGVGAIAGALVGMGIPREEAEWYEQEVRGGRTLVTVRADGRYDEAQRTMRRHGAYDVESRDMAGVAATTANAAEATARPTARGTTDAVTGHRTRRDRTEDTDRVELRQEEPRARKETVDAGQEIRIPLREEHVTLEKQTVVVQEVAVGKRVVEQPEHVEGTVRKEVPRVTTTGDADVHGNVSAGRWEDEMPHYRQSFQQRHGTSGRRWDDYEPGYRYGWEMRKDPRYQGRAWTDVEPDLRRDWTTRHPNTPWERAGMAIREAWENLRPVPLL